MGEPLSPVVCPNCAAARPVDGGALGRACANCGQPFEPPRDNDEQASDSDVIDEGFVTNLRQAFELDAAALRSPGPCRLRGSAGSSTIAVERMTAPTLATGQRLGDFEILDEIGRGGMGVVYRARQVSLGRQVALKVLPAGAGRGERGVRRFKTEAQAAGRLHHTNIVPVHAQGEQGGHFYYAMELVDGIGLETAIHGRPELLRPSPGRGASDEEPAETTASSPRRTPADYRHLARLLSEVADALDCAHRHGVIHRDVKPRNLLLGKNGRLHLTDFGLARLTDAPHLTLDGEVMGTPAYLAPEQTGGGDVDHRADVYALGVTLYEALTRRKPFDGQTREEVLSAICTKPPKPPRQLDPDIPLSLETICLRAMEKDPAGRHQSAAELAEDLQRYSEGRRILSRRPGRVVRSARWATRHKLPVGAGAAVVAAALLCIVMAGSAAAARQREAGRLLRDAYEQLAHVDYRAPERVAADVERADALGADADELNLVRALMCLGAQDQITAIEHLEALLRHQPADLRALYMLAWAQWRSGAHADGRRTLALADEYGPPTAGDEWFFRGLAVHFDQPDEAVESYRQAIAARAEMRAFHPQAVLHLARAQNQRIYATRGLDAFPEAVASLRQLVQQQQYGAYPYYLLSIAHRLAAEIYSGSSGTRGASLVAEHYAQALEWARKGQEVEPANDRPITAEAECLESMGQYAPAIAARTRALEVAAEDVRRWEGHHYRWRLYYWTGQWEAALDDLRQAAGYDPDCPFYAHVYPALVLAEMGDMAAAREHARAIVEDAPDSALAVIWSAGCLRLLGRADEAADLLTDRAEQVDSAVGLVPPRTEDWVQALYAHCRDGSRAELLDDLAARASTPWKLWGEARFHEGLLLLGRADRTGAAASLLEAYRSFDGERRYTYHARLLLERTRQDSTWPPWITPSEAAPSAADSDNEQTGGV